MPLTILQPCFKIATVTDDVYDGSVFFRPSRFPSEVWAGRPEFKPNFSGRRTKLVWTVSYRLREEGIIQASTSCDSNCLGAVSEKLSLSRLSIRSPHDFFSPNSIGIEYGLVTTFPVSSAIWRLFWTLVRSVSPRCHFQICLLMCSTRTMEYSGASYRRTEILTMRKC